MTHLVQTQYRMIRARKCAYQGERNDIFYEKFVYVLYGWSLSRINYSYSWIFLICNYYITSICFIF